MNVRCKNENAAKFCVSVGENCVTKILIRYSIIISECIRMRIHLQNTSEYFSYEMSIRTLNFNDIRTRYKQFRIKK